MRVDSVMLFELDREPPEGFVCKAEFLSPEEQSGLLRASGLNGRGVRMHANAAATSRDFGLH